MPRRRRVDLGHTPWYARPQPEGMTGASRVGQAMSEWAAREGFRWSVRATANRFGYRFRVERESFRRVRETGEFLPFTWAVELTISDTELVRNPDALVQQVQQAFMNAWQTHLREDKWGFLQEGVRQAAQDAPFGRPRMSGATGRAVPGIIAPTVPDETVSGAVANGASGNSMSTTRTATGATTASATSNGAATVTTSRPTAGDGRTFVTGGNREGGRSDMITRLALSWDTQRFQEAMQRVQRQLNQVGQVVTALAAMDDDTRRGAAALPSPSSWSARSGASSSPSDADPDSVAEQEMVPGEGLAHSD